MSKLLKIAIAIASVLGLMVLALPQIWNPFSRDHGEITGCAQVMLRGGALYKDCWENKGLLTYVFFMLPVAIAPNILAVRLFDVVWQGATAWAVSICLGRMTENKRIGLLTAACYFVLYVTSGFWNTLQSETFSAVFILLNIYLAWRATSKQRNALLSGICIGIAIWIKYTFAFIGLGTGALLLLAVWLAHKKFQPVVRTAFAYALGIALVTAVVAAYLTVNNVWDAFFRHLEFLSGPFAVRRTFADATYAFWQSLRGYLSDGVHIGPVAKPTVEIWGTLGFGFPLLVLLAVYAVWQHRRNVRVWLFALAFITAYANVAYQARYSPYHHMAMLLPLVCTAAFALLSQTQTLARLAFAIVITAASVAHIPALKDWYSNVVVQGKTPLQMYRDTSMFDELLLSDWIQAHTQPQDTVSIWGIAASTYFVAQRQNATRFFFVLPFEYDSPFRAEWMAQYVRDMQTHPPKYFFVTKDNYPFPNYGVQGLLRQSKPINDYVEAHYVYIGELQNFLIYERKP